MSARHMRVLPVPICSHLIGLSIIVPTNGKTHKIPPRGKSYEPGCRCISQFARLTKYFRFPPDSSKGVNSGSMSRLGRVSVSISNILARDLYAL